MRVNVFFCTVTCCEGAVLELLSGMDALAVYVPGASLIVKDPLASVLVLVLLPSASVIEIVAAVRLGGHDCGLSQSPFMTAAPFTPDFSASSVGIVRLAVMAINAHKITADITIRAALRYARLRLLLLITISFAYCEQGVNSISGINSLQQ